MPYLARKLDRGQEWFDIRADTAEPALDILPPLVCAEFVPRPSDKGWLSLFKIGEATTAGLMQVAAAMSLFAGVEAANKRQFFAVVSEEELVKLGFELRDSPGGTYHKAVDATHVEMKITSTEAVLKAVRLFWSGGTVEAKGQKIIDQRRTDIRRGVIDLSAAIRAKQTSGGHVEHAIANTKEGNLDLIGVELLAQPGKT